MISLDKYHRYAAFFDAARALPEYQYVRLSGNEAGCAFRVWAGLKGLDVIETTLVRDQSGRKIEWMALEVPGCGVGVHLDDQAPDAAATEQATSVEDEPEIAF